MHFKWLNNSQPLRTSDKIPYHLKELAINFPQARYEQYEEGETLAQIFSGIDFSIWLHHAIMKEDTRVNLHVDVAIRTINYMRIGNIKAILKGAGEVLLETGKCAMFYIPQNVLHEAILPKGLISCLHINFHPIHLLPMARQYSEFDPMLSQTMHGLNEGRQQMEISITSEMEEYIQMILNCKFSAGEKEIFYQARIRDLLRLYGAALGKIKKIEGFMDPEEKILAKMEYYILQHLNRRLSIVTISEYLNINRTTLQKIVSKKYKCGVHKLVVKMRMETAAEKLMNTSESVSAVVLQTSDMTFAAFSAAFKKYYSISPLEYRKVGLRNRKK